MFKYPSFRNGIKAFISGCYSNWMERWYIKQLTYKKSNLYNQKDLMLIPPSYFCTWFGLIQIQHYCTPLHRELKMKEMLMFCKISGNDLKPKNFGYYDGTLVCFDYGAQVNPYKFIKIS